MKFQKTCRTKLWIWLRGMLTDQNICANRSQLVGRLPQKFLNKSEITYILLSGGSAIFLRTAFHLWLRTTSTKYKDWLWNYKKQELWKLGLGFWVDPALSYPSSLKILGLELLNSREEMSRWGCQHFFHRGSFIGRFGYSGVDFLPNF